MGNWDLREINKGQTQSLRNKLKEIREKPRTWRGRKWRTINLINENRVIVYKNKVSNPNGVGSIYSRGTMMSHKWSQKDGQAN